MILYPAIDVMNGKCVRLYKGDFAQSVTYSDSPVDTARQFADEGATWLHLVDLDGAKNPEQRQTNLIAEIIGSTGLSIQTGGGIRSEEDVETLLKAGAKRVVIGSLSVKEPDTVQNMLTHFGADQVVLAMDVQAKDNTYYVATSGWQENSDVTLPDLIRVYQSHGLKHLLCTDIARDGTMGGTNVDLYRDLKKDFPDLHIQASGGVSSLDDLVNLSKADASGAIVGKALYENAFTLREALQFTSGT